MTESNRAEPSVREGSNAFAWFHATSVNGGAMTIAAVIASYFSVHLTDDIGMTAGAASLIMFIATLWDAINDPMMGIIADRTKSRWGRYRPYFFAAPILLLIFSVLIWVNPGLESVGTFFFILIAYIGYGMTVTMYTMPQMAVLPAVVRDTQRRNTIIGMGAGVCAVAFTVGNTFTPQITGFFSGLGFENPYIPFMVVLSALAFVSFWGLFGTTREKYLTPVSRENPLKPLGTVLRHKEVWPNIVAWVMASMGYGMMFSTSVYYCMYFLGRPDLISAYMAVISIAALVSMVVLMPIFLRVFKTGQRALLVSQVASIVCYIILFFTGNMNFVWLCVMTFISSCFASMQNALVNVLVNDCIDFVMLKDGISANGVISSIKGFAQKCGNTVVSSGILAVLGLAGYVAGAIGRQNETTMFALNFLKFGAPCITGVILILCVVFNPFQKHYAEIEEMKKNLKDISEQAE
ncbi:MFS transporter [Lachnoclostridium sp. Marseille-P6806]|uniref:MFS transporter n=1 Tax=Lachnoclostridium sp. Marseille-P6806 TaxID=2364793 RepID=UPI001031102D|nr:MFS transporter [Lachnoclostridium sp. Marseille-P6806]